MLKQETLEQGVAYVQVNNRDTRTAPMTLFLTLSRQMPDGMLVFKISLNRSKLTAARQGGFIVLHV